MKPSIYIPQKYLDQLEKNSNKLLKEIGKKKFGLLQKQARLIRDRIRARAPRGETGLLKKACYARAYPETTTRPAVAFAGIRPRRAPHAHLVEFGHAGLHPAPPHPFFRPAVDGCREEVMRNIQTGLKKTVKGAV